MKRFLLLRDNQERGPFSLQELKDMGLRPNDLIWIEGESLAWNYPSKIAELKSISNPFSYRDSPVNEMETYRTPLTFTNGEPVAFPEGDIPTSGNRGAAESSHHFHNEEPEQDNSKANSTQEQHAKRKLFYSYGIWLIAIFFLLGGTTWIIKKTIDIITGQNLNKNKMSLVVAPLKTLPEGVSPQKTEDATYQNAISREIVPVDTTEAKEPIKMKPKLKELKKYLQVESNDYKVGVFGGINNLQLTVINNSSHVLDKVVLQVDYLKPKGEPVETEKYTYFSIPPHGKKTLDIPPSKRGVKVRYKIVDAKSREYKVAMVQA